MRQLEIKEFFSVSYKLSLQFLARRRFLLVGVIRAKKNYLKGSPMGASLGGTVLDCRIQEC